MEIARLRAREVELAGTILTHAYWSSLAPADVLTVRDALKHHREQLADASSQCRIRQRSPCPTRWSSVDCGQPPRAKA
ncbi:hypothetical protein [Streptomyces sp. NPDC056820]|uniref:hypothetical protein n=1 Tax=Streptomyces sp. NPDC056820 TaxID=3345951 RepID=UPI0036A8E464